MTDAEKAERRAGELRQALEDIDGMLDDDEYGPPLQTILEELGTLQGEVARLRGLRERVKTWAGESLILTRRNEDGEVAVDPEEIAELVGILGMEVKTDEH